MPTTSGEGPWYTTVLSDTSKLDMTNIYRSVGWQWLASTRELQSRHFGVNYDELQGEKLADYMRTQIAAMASELGEFSQEVDWKPWVNGDGDRGWVNRENAVRELVDLAHFVANALCAMGVTDQEWEASYQAKQQVNRDRQAQGYDARSTKCECGRAFEDMVPWEDYDMDISRTVPGRMCSCGKFYPKT